MQSMWQATRCKPRNTVVTTWQLRDNTCWVISIVIRIYVHVLWLTLSFRYVNNEWQYAKHRVDPITYLAAYIRYIFRCLNVIRYIVSKRHTVIDGNWTPFNNPFASSLSSPSSRSDYFVFCYECNVVQVILFSFLYTWLLNWL